MNSYTDNKFPKDHKEIKPGSYVVGGIQYEVKEKFRIGEVNPIIVATRLDDYKDVIIKYILREPKNEKSNKYCEMEKKYLTRFSYHPNLVSLLKTYDNKVIIEKGYTFHKRNLNSFFFKNYDKSNTDDAIVRSLFCQYVVFLSFGHFVGCFQRDVKLDNFVAFPSIFSDQIPHAKAIDLELSSIDQIIAFSVVYPNKNDEKGESFFNSIRGSSYHSHLMDCHYLCYAFSQNILDRIGLGDKTESIKEISDFISKERNEMVTLYDIIKTKYIQEREVYFYNFLPNERNLKNIKVKDIIETIQNIDTSKSNIFVRYLSTPHTFQFEKISFNNLLFPYYSMNSIYILPKDLKNLYYDSESNFDSLKIILCELISNIQFLYEDCKTCIDDTKYIYSFMNKNYEDRFKKLRSSHAEFKSYIEIKEKLLPKSFKSLIEIFYNIFEHYQNDVLINRGYYQKIEENKNKHFNSKEEFKTIEKFIKNNNNNINLKNFEEIVDDNIDESLLTDEYFKTESKCLKDIQDFIEIGNQLSKKNEMGSSNKLFKLDKKNKEREDQLMNIDINKMDSEINSITSEIKSIKFFLSQKKTLTDTECNNLSKSDQDDLKIHLDTKQKLQKNFSELNDIIMEIKNKKEIYEEKKLELKYINKLTKEKVDHLEKK